MELAMVGLGRMGMNMARRLLRGGHEVIAYNRTPEKVRDAEKEGARPASSLEEAVKMLTPPRTVWLMLPAGSVVDHHIDELLGLMSEGDIIVDGGNSYYRDDIKRFERLREGGIHYVDVGVSGGVWGLKTGYCLMAGGEKEICERLTPLFTTLAPEEGYLYCGLSGAGHFVKMVHNGIEYGMMEAYGEGFEILRASPYGADLALKDVAHLWNRGSVIRSWLLELTEEAFKKDPALSSIKGYVEDSGEGRWTVQQAVETGVAAPVITLSLFQRFRSRMEETFNEKVLAAMRREFGGHAVMGLSEERREKGAGAGGVKIATRDRGKG
ncbi:MAG: phosphogluconate dehydrogenase (NAD(+)-dependent, decarboxylating) [Thermodesulfobacteriota bacterium]